ncbi:hypothetical protein [Brevundimonas sp.]|uniref:hypothetical protein n=1 Tax=Brevundimonas sp. TaxID=1871086 RepID=UPI0025BF191B|nr:hypothetical protein [Brevundimonas sp.]
MDQIVQPRSRRQESVGFLDNVLDIAGFKTPPTQPGAQIRLVRQDVPVEPARAFEADLFGQRPLRRGRFRGIL